MHPHNAKGCLSPANYARLDGGGDKDSIKCLSYNLVHVLGTFVG